MASEYRAYLPALLGMLVGVITASALLTQNFRSNQTNFEDAAAFGAQTTSVFGSVHGHRVHCGDARDAELCLAGARERKAKDAALWLGNSQVHAVNQLRAGEVNAPILLHEHLNAAGLDLLTFSQPNANLQEHWVLFEYLANRLPVKALILPAVFDDTREAGLRIDIAQLLNDPEVHKRLSTKALGKKIIASNEQAVRKPQLDDTAGIQDTLQEKAEHRLTSWLEEHSGIWKARPEMRGRLMNALYSFRNTVLGITPSSKRKAIRGRYVDNMAALRGLLESAAERGIATVVYVAPIRQDAELPYVDNEYTAFKIEVRDLAAQTGAGYSNLETLVPSNFWGVKQATSVGGTAEIDFMHFQAEGHRLLAQRLSELVLTRRSIGAKQQ